MTIKNDENKQNQIDKKQKVLKTRQTHKISQTLENNIPKKKTEKS